MSCEEDVVELFPIFRKQPPPYGDPDRPSRENVGSTSFSNPFAHARNGLANAWHARLIGVLQS
jgi:hypothetical protein